MDDRAYRNAMGQFATGVTIITSKVEDEVYGMTCNAFKSVSLNPKLIAISIGNEANMLKRIKESNQFSVNVLTEKQKAVSMHFAGQKSDESVVDFGSIKDIPIINEALLSVVCDVDDTIVVGDHTLFIGRVLDVVIGEGEPLTFHGGKYGVNKITN